MAGLKKSLLGDDPEVGAFRIKMDRSIQDLHPRRGDAARRRSLHVSDFTASDRDWCARKLLVRWWRGDSRDWTSVIQRDGKFREQKWHEQFVRAGIMVEYQPEFRLGLLVGHPDWILDWGFGPRVIDLTGQDPTVDIIVRSKHTAAKKRQVRLYNIMGDFKRGYVIVENKANSEFQFLPVERDEREEGAVTSRVAAVSQVVGDLGDEPNELQVMDSMMRLSPCQREKCPWCKVQAPHEAARALAEVPDSDLADVEVESVHDSPEG